jgi:purine-nucleoside phosphorylase
VRRRIAEIIGGLGGKSSNGEVLVHPVKGRSGPAAAPDLLMCMTGPLLDLAVSKAGAREIRVNDFGLYRVYETRDAPGSRARLTVTGPFLGAPQAVIGLEKMIASGASRVWAVGWCGSLQEDLRVGDLVLPLSAVSEEGTSRHYPLPGRAVEADPSLVESVRNCLDRRGLRADTGRVWTTDAPYRETRAKVERLKEQGVLAVDMEFSALLKVAAFRGVKLASLMVVSDELFTGEWRPGFSSRRLKDSSRLLLEVALEAASGFHSHQVQTRKECLYE